MLEDVERSWRTSLAMLRRTGAFPNLKNTSEEENTVSFVGWFLAKHLLGRIDQDYLQLFPLFSANTTVQL